MTKVHWTFFYYQASISLQGVYYDTWDTKLHFVNRWWECIALPDDVDTCDEVAFRMQIKELAFTVKYVHLDGLLYK